MHNNKRPIDSLIRIFQPRSKYKPSTHTLPHIWYVRLLIWKITAMLSTCLTLAITRIFHQGDILLAYIICTPLFWNYSTSWILVTIHFYSMLGHTNPWTKSLPFSRYFSNENNCISITISRKFISISTDIWTDATHPHHDVYSVSLTFVTFFAA